MNEVRLVEEKFGSLDYIPQGACVLRADLTVLFWNSCLEDWTQIPKAKIVGQPITDFFPHLAQPKYSSRLRQSLEAGVPTIFSSQLHKHVIPCLRYDGALRVQHTTVTPVPDLEQTGFYLLLSIQDVTDMTQQVQAYKTIQEKAWLEIRERQRVEEALRHQTQQERLIANITQHIRRSLDLKEVLQTTADELRQSLQADRVVIYHLDRVTDCSAVIVESCHPNYPALLGWTIGQVSQRWNAWLGLQEKGQIQAIADVTQLALHPAYAQLLRTFAVKAKLLLPIWHHETIWGVLAIHHCATLWQWQAWEMELLLRLEPQIVIALQQAELYQQVQQFNADLEQQVQQRTVQLQRALGFEALLKRITDKVRDSLDERLILQTAVQDLALALNAHSCHAALYDLDRHTATVCYEYTTTPPAQQGCVLRMADFPEIYQPLLQAQTLQFCSLAQQSGQAQWAILTCPIVDDQGVLGDLWLLHPPDQGFNEQEVRLVKQVANQCAIALRQARLYQTAQTQVEMLEKLNRLKDDFLSTVSHELRTPLASIRMSVQLLERLLAQPGVFCEQFKLGTGPHKVDHCLQILRDECDREMNLISDLLTLQQLEAGTQPLIPTPMRLQDWLAQIVETFEAQTSYQQQRLRVSIPATLPMVVTDPFMLTRIFKELLTNACKFTPAGEEITLTAGTIALSASASFAIQISITNAGVEIPAQELPRIFDQFYRIPSNDPWKYGGTGLGLNLVKRLVMYLGGAIWAESQARKTRITIELPSQPPMQSHPQLMTLTHRGVE